MWKNIRDFLSADATLELDGSGALSSEEVMIAVLALLLRAGYSDGELGAHELERAVEVVGEEFDVDTSAVRPHVEVADFLARNTTRISALIAAVKDHLSEPQKVEVVKSVWRVLDADKVSRKSEAAFAVEVRKLLGLSLEQSFFASLGRHR